MLPVRLRENPSDYYSGMNVVNLLLQRGDIAARAELAMLVPRVRSTVQEKLEADRPDFWDLATELQLAAIAHDWPGAERAALLVPAQMPSEWMLVAALRDLEAIGQTFAFDDPNDRSRLEDILGLLRSRNARVKSGG